MKTALLFSGLGEPSGYSAVQRSLTSDSPLTEHALQASGCSDDSIAQIGSRKLNQCQVLHPLLIALFLTEAKQIMANGFEPDYIAGHSLGELAGWAVAGALPPEDAVEIAALRGKAMERAANNHRGDMLALTDSDVFEAERMLDLGQKYGQLFVGAYNAPRQVVLTGTTRALQEVSPHCKSRRLNVGGPWHSPLMEGAKSEIAPALDKLSTGLRIRPVIESLKGECINDTKNIISHILAPLTQTLDWIATMATLDSLGVSHFVIAGPGRALRYLVRRNLPKAEVRLAERD